MDPEQPWRAAVHPEFGRAAVVHRPEEVNARWLESALGRRVRSLHCIDVVSTWAAHVCIVAEVDGAPVPLKLRVKIGSALVFGRNEVEYYCRTFSDLAEAPLVTCHHADADETHYYLLLDDLTETHRNQDDFAVTQAYGQGLVEALARLHAHRWGQSPPDATDVQASLRSPLAGLPTMLAAMEEGFTAVERAKVVDVFDRLPSALARRARDPSGFAWTHGDLNPGNILTPRTDPGRVLLIDYQPFGTSPPAHQLAISDLAHAMVLWWPEAGRRALAWQSVEHWNARLQSHGVGYASSHRLREDWELCVARTLLVPASRCSEPGAVTRHRILWELHVRRALAALGDSADWR